MKNHKSQKWVNLNEKYLCQIKKAKVSYSKKIVGDLKTSNPSQWYSKIKRMSNMNRDGDDQFYIEELSELSAQAQADTLAGFYASTRNQFEPVKDDDFSYILQSEVRQNVADILTTPEQVENIILSMNKKAACINGDIPLKIISFFGSHIYKPLCHIFNSIFISGKYPEIWKTEFITPVAKIYPPA